MIRLQGLRKIYGDKTVVSDVSMQMESGTITVIVGRSGSGKSTLLRMINRLIEPDAGSVDIDGVSTQDMRPHELRRRIGYVIQDNGLFPHWTVWRNIATVPTLLGWDTTTIHTRVTELLSLLQLDPEEIGPRYPHQLSGGQAQRVGVARALAARPDFLLMDEPFGALDPVIRTKAQTDLKDVQQRLGSTILLVTHDMTEAIRLGDQIAVMNEGRVEQLASPSNILAHPETAHVKDLVGDSERPFHFLSLLPITPHIEDGTAQGAPISSSGSLLDALAAMIWSDRDSIGVQDGNGSYLGVITQTQILHAARAEARA